MKALEEKGYSQPTPIQEKAIPLILTGRDILGTAQTGTGKTAAFCIPILQKLIATRGRGVRALILAPTRELAIQISDNIKLYSKHLDLTSSVIFGGVSQVKQVNELKRGVDILIATPGRLLDLVDQRLVNLSSVEMLVLDEADRMLDMGFVHDVRRITKLTPASRQNLLFSATLPPEVNKLIGELLKNPLTVAAEQQTKPPAIAQSVYYVPKESKRALLKHVIHEQDMRNVIVFARTKYGADRIAKDLNKSGITAEALHGDKSQGARQRALSNFKANVTRVLVATDIAARGIDIADLPYVINYELPQSAETYTHRIGRTGRAGALGNALSFCDHEEKAQLKNINRLAASSLTVVEHPFQ